MSPFEALYGYKPQLLPAVGGPFTELSVEEYLPRRREVLQQLK